MNKYYITTTLPYVNAKPHIGHALEFIQADAVARYHRLLGDEVIFNTGTDEHGVKIWNKAQEEGREIQAYVDEYAEKFGILKDKLNLSYNKFIRTTDEKHIKAAQKFWELCDKNGDIYKKNYQTKYCVGCELEKTDSELVDGKCPIHPNMDIELIDEKNYFFKFSAYTDKLLKLYSDNPEFIIPAHRQNEIKAFVERGLQDFSVSRLKSKMPWGIEVPGNSEHVMYVWFDALINYISTLGWGSDDEKEFEDFWPGVQVAGKDNLRQQTAMWQAMLMSAGISNSKQVFIHGFINSGGQKMSKTMGNVVGPIEIQEKYGTDALRFFMLGGMNSYEDGDFTVERFEEFYTAHLVNGVGNLTSRILTMLENYSGGKVPGKHGGGVKKAIEENLWDKYEYLFKDYNFLLNITNINCGVSVLDELISNEKPWEKFKAGEDIAPLLYELAEGLRHIGLALLPIIPESAKIILNSLGVENVDKLNLEEEKEWGRLKPETKVKKPESLFPRLKK